MKYNKFWEGYFSSGLKPLLVFVVTIFLASFFSFFYHIVFGEGGAFISSILNMVIIIPILGIIGAFIYQVRKKFWKEAVLNFLILFWIFFIG